MTELHVIVKNPFDVIGVNASIGWNAKIGNKSYGSYMLVPSDTSRDEFIAAINLMVRNAYETEDELLSVRGEREPGSAGHAPHLQRTVPEEE